jgi:hypothetical protein
MQNQTQTRTALSDGKIFAAATALLVASVLVINGVPRTANAASAFGSASALPSATTVHDGVDWSRVAAAPVDTGATVAAYDR